MKKMLCLLLSVIFVWSVYVPVLAGDMQSGDYTYSVNADGETATITGYTGTAEILEIPSKLDDYTVTAIGTKVFAENRKTDTVKIPGTVKTIGESAFENCCSLRVIDLAEGVTTIGEKAFHGTSIRRAIIPNTVKSIGVDAFALSNDATVLYVNYNGTESEWNKIDVDGGNWWLTSSERIVFISEENSDYSYYRDMDLREYENEYYGAWFICEYRGTEKNVVVPETLDGHYMAVIGGFSGNEYIESVTISSTNTINNRAFADCKNLKTVKIEGAAYIYPDAFSNCTSLKTVYLPKSLESIYDVFDNCESLDTVYFGGSREEWLGVHIIDDHEALEDSNVQCAFDFENESVFLKPYESTLDGIKISWEEHYGAEKYDVYKRDETGYKWIKIGITDKTYFVDTDVKVKKSGTYTVRARKGNTVSKIPAGQNTTFYEAPKIKCLRNANGGVHIEWNKTEYADGYYVYRHTPDGYRRIGATKGTSFVDTNVKSNTKYTYTVRGYSSRFKSKFSAFHKGTAITYLATPSISSIDNVTKGIKLNWNKIGGASNYYVYRRTTGGWTRLGKIAGTTFVDKAAKSGVIYEYTVRALNSITQSSFEEGKSINDFRKGTGSTVLATPSISFIDNATSGVKLSWNKTDGADYYYVYRKTTGGWIRLGKIEGTTFVDASAESGVTYTYTVRALNTVAKSSFEDGKSIMRLAVPALRTLTHAHGINTLKFDAVPGAEYYIVYKKSLGKDWSNIGTTTSTKYVDTFSASNGGTYSVRAVCGETRSYYDVFGMSVYPNLPY